jgi:hypothetical protein
MELEATAVAAGCGGGGGRATLTGDRKTAREDNQKTE